ncbi:MAG TPA: divergent polysaccharide deacetylase family protein, partial [Candidatus Desulfofervidus auxilii]|nr:divergent polysaccharide deacetylase family protein [Candidatus Desulfofervidus auxilii]
TNIKSSFSTLSQKKHIQVVFKRQWRIIITYCNIITHHIIFKPYKKRPFLAIIVDDLGYNLNVVRELLNMNLPLNYSILPFLPYTKEIAQWLHIVDAEILLHLPMEAQRHFYLNHQPGMLFVNMPKTTLMLQLRRDLEAVPFIKGVNNHMGSKFTQDIVAMSLVLSEIKKRGLYFVDSFTTPRSVGYKLAKRMGLRSVRADLFLDAYQDPLSIKEHLKKLTTKAKTEGAALGICHPYPNTIAILKKELPKLLNKFEFLTISDFILYLTEQSSQNSR